MAKPLRSDDPNPKNMQFKHFGVLNDGTQSKGAFTTSIVTNLILAALVIIIGSAVKNIVAPPKKTDLTFVTPEKPPPPPPPPPKIKIPPPPPEKIEPPKIKLPDPPKVPEIKPVEMKMAPTPVKLAPAPPKKVSPPPAPVVVKIAPARAASVPNHDANPSPVRLGNLTNPLKPMTGPAVSRVNLGVAGSPGMPSHNTGSGNPTKVSIGGSGSPYGTNMNGHDNAARPVKGFGNGIPNGTGKPGGTAPTAVNMGPPPQQAQRTPPPAHDSPASSPPTMTYRPQPQYTAEAKAAHIEGAVSLSIRVSASGAVQVLGVTRSLGHGLDEQAIRTMQGARFTPAHDASGRPVDWTGVVKVNFLLAS